jgi:hypothetical protein
MREREFRKLSVHGTGGLQLAGIKKETVRFEASKIERFFARDHLAQRRYVESLFDPRNCDVRRIGVWFAGNAQRRGSGIRIGRQLSQIRRIHAAPKKTRLIRVQKSANIAHVYGYGVARRQPG